MYSQNDLDEAVAAGAMSAEAAASLRSFVDGQRSSPAVDEENFRLITGFNDIFVSIAAAILLVRRRLDRPVGSVSRTGLIVDVDGPSSIGACSRSRDRWGLALFFTAKRRMALPSILLLLAFVAACSPPLASRS